MCVPLTLQNSHQPLLFFSSAMVTARCQVAVYLKRHGSSHITPLILRCTICFHAATCYISNMCVFILYVWSALIFLTVFDSADATLQILHFLTACCSIKRHEKAYQTFFFFMVLQREVMPSFTSQFHFTLCMSKCPWARHGWTCPLL